MIANKINSSWKNENYTTNHVKKWVIIVDCYETLDYIRDIISDFKEKGK